MNDFFFACNYRHGMCFRMRMSCVFVCVCHVFSYNPFYFDFHSARITDSKSCQIIESILKYKNGFKNNLMYKEIFN